jgi:hypothetical protein
LAKLRRIARAHPGASPGERAAWEILQNLREGRAVDFTGSLVRLDGTGRFAVAQLVADLAIGKTALFELR